VRPADIALFLIGEPSEHAGINAHDVAAFPRSEVTVCDPATDGASGNGEVIRHVADGQERGFLAGGGTPVAAGLSLLGQA